jgi:hypothetical protein
MKNYLLLLLFAISFVMNGQDLSNKIEKDPKTNNEILDLEPRIIIAERNQVIVNK